MIYAIYVALALIAFLIVFIGFLQRNAINNNRKAVFSLVLIGLVITAFYVSGWKHGLFAIVVAYLSTILVRPIAARLVSNLLGRWTDPNTRYVGLPPRPIQRISKRLGELAGIDDIQILSKKINSGESRRAEAALLDYCEAQPGIRAMMKEFRISRKELREVYHQLLEIGAGHWACGHWVPASTLAYPEALRYILERRGENLHILQKTAYELIMYFMRGSALKHDTSGEKVG